MFWGLFSNILQTKDTAMFSIMLYKNWSELYLRKTHMPSQHICQVMGYTSCVLYMFLIFRNSVEWNVAR